MAETTGTPGSVAGAGFVAPGSASPESGVWAAPAGIPVPGMKAPEAIVPTDIVDQLTWSDTPEAPAAPTPVELSPDISPEERARMEKYAKDERLAKVARTLGSLLAEDRSYEAQIIAKVVDARLADMERKEGKEARAAKEADMLNHGKTSYENKLENMEKRASRRAAAASTIPTSEAHPSVTTKEAPTSAPKAAGKPLPPPEAPAVAPEAPKGDKTDAEPAAEIKAADAEVGLADLVTMLAEARHTNDRGAAKRIEAAIADRLEGMDETTLKVIRASMGEVLKGADRTRKAHDTLKAFDRLLSPKSAPEAEADPVADARDAVAESLEVEVEKPAKAPLKIRKEPTTPADLAQETKDREDAARKKPPLRSTLMGGFKAVLDKHGLSQNYPEGATYDKFTPHGVSPEWEDPDSRTLREHFITKPADIAGRVFELPDGKKVTIVEYVEEKKSTDPDAPVDRARLKGFYEIVMPDGKKQHLPAEDLYTLLLNNATEVDMRTTATTSAAASVEAAPVVDPVAEARKAEAAWVDRLFGTERDQAVGSVFTAKDGSRFMISAYDSSRGTFDLVDITKPGDRKKLPAITRDGFSSLLDAHRR